MDSNHVQIQRALLSVSDKTDLIPFARCLVRHGATLISTGGTARALKEAGLEVTPVEAVTGFPEIMDGRVKTLHPAIHGGLLARRDLDDHVAAMQRHDIDPIDLVCVNLYPFEQTVASGDVSEDEAIEQIDIGGPSMIRSAAKNHRHVAVLTDPAQYDRVSQDLDAHDGATDASLRRWLAAAAFARTSAYDTAIAEWMARQDPRIAGGEAVHFPDPSILRLNRSSELRYGENPHQAAALYLEPSSKEPAVARARCIHGKALSFCNLYDADGALELIKEVDPARQAAAAVIKHANPCGFATANTLPEAFQKAFEGDPLAAYGGILACNRPIDGDTARRITGVTGLDVIVAPAFEDEGARLLRERWKNTRLMEVGPLPAPAQRDTSARDLKRITGGMLVQDRDLTPLDRDAWRHVSGPVPSDDDRHQLWLATVAVKYLKSNAVCIVRDDMLVGAGAGQMDRLSSCGIAVNKAGPRARDGYAASDGLFPFRDGPDQLIEAGVKAIVQPGGSKRDDESIAACEEAGVTMLFTGQRLFRH